MSSAKILDLRGCTFSNRYYGGAAGKKEGILIDGEPWIAKFPQSTREMRGKHLPSYTSSPVSEYLGSHFYEMLGIPAHETELGYLDGKIVCACKDFTYPDRRLYMLSELKTSLDDDEPGYHHAPSDGSSLYLTDVLQTIQTHRILRELDGSLARFWDMFVVDALIKNPDRNNGNWGVLLDSGGNFSLAPVYDNGASFFNKRTPSAFERRNDDDDALFQDAFGTNVSCYLVMGDDGKPHHIHPFDYMAETVNADLDAAILRVADAFDPTRFENLVESIPREAYGWPLMSDAARESHIQLVEKRVREGLMPLADEIRKAYSPDDDYAHGSYGIETSMDEHVRIDTSDERDIR